MFSCMGEIGVEQDVLRGAPVPVYNSEHHRKSGTSPKTSSKTGSDTTVDGQSLLKRLLKQSRLIEPPSLLSRK